MTEQEVIEELKDCAVYIVNDNQEREYSLCDKNIAIDIAIKALENQIKIKQILSDSNLDEDDCLMKIWEIVDEK